MINVLTTARWPVQTVRYRPTDAMKLEEQSVKSLLPTLEFSDIDQSSKKPETKNRQKNEDEGVHIHLAMW